MSKSTKAPAPMDPSIREEANPVFTPNNKRVCYAAQTLVEEFTALFPETPVEYSNYDGWNVAHDVSFDLTTLTNGDRSVAANLLDLTHTDIRVDEVTEEDDITLVSFHKSARTRDSRNLFGLSDAFDILTDAATMESDGIMDPTFSADLAQHQKDNS